MAEIPPSYTSQKPKSNSNTALFVILGLIAVCCVGGVILVFVVGGGLFKQALGVGGCTIEFKAARDAVLDYAQAHNGKLPDADKWQDEVRQYYSKEVDNEYPKKAQEKIHMDIPGPDDPWGCQTGNNQPQTGMAFNSALSGKDINKLSDPDTVVLFEVPTAGKNLSEPYKPSPDETGPKVFGQPRGWFWIGIRGDAKSTNQNFKTSSDSS